MALVPKSTFPDLPGLEIETGYETGIGISACSVEGDLDTGLCDVPHEEGCHR